MAWRGAVRPTNWSTVNKTDRHEGGKRVRVAPCGSQLLQEHDTTAACMFYSKTQGRRGVSVAFPCKILCPPLAALRKKSRCAQDHDTYSDIRAGHKASPLHSGGKTFYLLLTCLSSCSSCNAPAAGPCSATLEAKRRSVGHAAGCLSDCYHAFRCVSAEQKKQQQKTTTTNNQHVTN